MDARLMEALDEAVARGIISPDQRDQVLHLAGESTEGARGRTGELLAWAREAPRGFNAITVAYGVGALAVVFALGWFLADRWTILGARGVLIVSLVYMGVFSLAARTFTRERFPTAHGVAIGLVIVTVPLVLWAVLHVAGVWVDPPYGACQFSDRSFWDCRSPLVVLAASMFAATLVAMRWLRFGPLMIPGAASLTVVLATLSLEVSRTPGGVELVGWAFTFTASVLATIAYETDRRHRREDYGRWLHFAAAGCAAVALVGLFGAEEDARHLLLPTSLAAMAASLFLRRIVWLALGLGGLFGYLTWLATSVFEKTVAFPVILALVGVTIILVTVWVQRAYPRLAARVREADGAAARFPGGSGLLLAPALVAVIVMPPSREVAVWERSYRNATVRSDRATMQRLAPAPARSARPPQGAAAAPAAGPAGATR